MFHNFLQLNAQVLTKRCLSQSRISHKSHNPHKKELGRAQQSYECILLFKHNFQELVTYDTSNQMIIFHFDLQVTQYLDSITIDT
jgi:hypothetical protein